MKKFFAVLMVLLMANGVMAQMRYDSASIDPTYIESGDDVDIFVKFHEGLTKRDIYSANPDNVVSTGASKYYYFTTIEAEDQTTSKYILIKKGLKNIGRLFTGESWTSHFEVHVADDAPATEYTLSFKVKKSLDEDLKNPETVLSRDISFEVKGEPKFTLTSDSLLNAGETKDFKIVVSNVGGGIAKKVTVSLNATHPLTVLKSSSINAGDLVGKKSAQLSYELYIDSAADSKAYTIPVVITYVDRSGNEISIKDSLGVKVQGLSEITAAMIEQQELRQNKEGAVSVEVINKGFVDAKFLSIEVVDTKDYEVTSAKEIYIGNIASDDFESEEFTVKIAEGVSGKIPLKVRVTYVEENNNQQITKDFDLQINVLSDEEYKILHPSADTTSQILGFVLIVPAAIVAYVVIWLLFKLVGAITNYIDKKLFRKG